MERYSEAMSTTSTTSKTSTPTDTDKELLRLHRRACTDFAARLRLPAWEHLTLELAPPLAPRSVADLLAQVAAGNLKAAAALCGQPEPPSPKLENSPAEVSVEVSVEVVVESIRTVLTVAAGLTGELSPAASDLLWNRAAELTVLGYDLQQAIRAGAGLDEILVDRLIAAEREPHVWPYLEPLPTDLGTVPLTRLLALTGRPAGMWVDPADPNCETGQC